MIVKLQNSDQHLKVDEADLPRVVDREWVLVGGQVVTVVDDQPVTAAAFLFQDGRVEFVNGDTTDLRRDNVRVVGRAKRVSPYKGVRWWHPKGRNGKWRAVLSWNSKDYTLGHADTPEEAHAIYLAKADARRAELEALKRTQ